MKIHSKIDLLGNLNNPGLNVLDNSLNMFSTFDLKFEFVHLFIHLFMYLLIFKTSSHYVAELKVNIFLLYPPECWNFIFNISL